MDFNATKMFVSVVQAGSLSAAADKTHVPLPTLSRRIRELERELDVQLLERSPRGIKLTEAADPIIREVDSVISSTRGEILSGITTDEVQLLVGLIGKLEQNITELQNKQ